MPDEYDTDGRRARRRDPNEGATDRYPPGLPTAGASMGPARSATDNHGILAAAPRRVPCPEVLRLPRGASADFTWATWWPGAPGVHVTLTMGSDGRARGRLRPPRPELPLLPGGFRPRLYGPTTAPGQATLDPAELADPEGLFALGVQLPGVTAGRLGDLFWVCDLRCVSWATVDPTGTVRQHGPRQLWERVETAWSRWRGSGCPPRTRYGLSVGPGGQRVWLDEPGADDWPVF